MFRGNQKQKDSDDLLSASGTQIDENSTSPTRNTSKKSLGKLGLGLGSGAQKLLFTLQQITQPINKFPQYKGRRDASAGSSCRGPNRTARVQPAPPSCLPPSLPVGKDTAQSNAWAGVLPDLPDDEGDVDLASSPSARGREVAQGTPGRAVEYASSPRNKDSSRPGTRDSSRPVTSEYSSRPGTRDSSRPVTSDSKGTSGSTRYPPSVSSSLSTVLNANSLCHGQKPLSKSGVVSGSFTTLPGNGWPDNQVLGMDTHLSAQTLTACSSISSYLLDSPWRQAIKEERAAELADRYTSGMQRLTASQKDWRRKHENLMQQRRMEAEVEKPKPKPTVVKRESQRRKKSKRNRSNQEIEPQSSKSDLLEWKSEEGARYLKNRSFFTTIDYDRPAGSPANWKSKETYTELPLTAPAPAVEEPEDAVPNFADLRPNSKLNQRGPDTQMSAAEQAAVNEAMISSKDVVSKITFYAKKFGLSSSDVKDTYLEFTKLDVDGSGYLKRDEFVEGVQAKLKKEGKRISTALFSKEVLSADVDGDQKIDFEEFLAWSKNVAFTKEMNCDSDEDWQLREFARECNVSLTDMEEIRKAFDRFDGDKSGNIDKDEFKSVLTKLLGVKDASQMPPDRFERYWMEVDINRSGDIAFDEFVFWYLKYFFVSSSDRERGVIALSHQYASLGAGRLQNPLDH